MASFLLDTSAYSEFNRGDDRLKPIFKSANDLAIPLIVIGELRAGFAAGSRIAENESLLQQFLDSSNVRVLTVSEQTTRLYATTYLQLRQAGKPIGTNDLWIAALALEHDLELVTVDSDFTAITDLKRTKL